jgi:hypothetical protein
MFILCLKIICKEIQIFNLRKLEEWSNLSKIFNSMSKSLLKGKPIKDPVQMENLYQEKILDLELKLKMVTDELNEKLNLKEESIPIVETTIVGTENVPVPPSVPIEAPLSTGGPPPPPGPSGPPPPGPGGPLGLSKNGNNFGIKLPDIPISPITEPTKVIHFQKVERRHISKSIFVQLGLIEKSTMLSKDLDPSEISVIFAKETSSTNLKPTKSIIVEPLANLLDGQLDQNISLGLQSLKRRGFQKNEDLRNLLLAVDSNIDMDILVQLKSIAPSEEDVEKVSNYKGEDKLSDAETFIKSIMDIKNVQGRIESWIQMISFTEDYNRLNSKIRTVRESCKELKTSENFHLM